MSGKKVALWAVVISAVLVTAGLILSCGDDDNGDAAVSCQDVCEKLDYCKQFPLSSEVGYFFEYYPGTCVETCEEMLEDEDDQNVVDQDLLECIMDTDCLDIKGSCFCKEACENLIDCDYYWWFDTLTECVYYCEDEIPLGYIAWCILYFSPDCDDIGDYCD